MSAQRSSIIETRVSFYIQFVFCSVVIFFFADVALCFIFWMKKYESALALLMDLNILMGFIYCNYWITCNPIVHFSPSF